MEDNPQNKLENRNPDGTYKPGVSGNPGGRPKGTMKEFISKKFREMTDEQKDAWLKEHKVQGIDQWKMGEGNPHSTEDVTSDGKELNQILVKFLNGNDNTDTK